jgi:hypothetical protein
MEFDAKGRRIEATGVTLVYAVLLALVATRHEPWFDEAQAWLLARDSTLRELLFDRARYEGSPALWHLILTIPTRLRLPYRAITFFGALPAVAGVWIWSRYSPFPRLLRWAVPFTFFLFYQYAVVSRSYNLMPPLIFGLAALHRYARRRPLAYAVLLALLANTCLPGTLIAGALLLLQIRRISPAGLAVSSAGIALALATAWPPADIAFARGLAATTPFAFLDGAAQMMTDSLSEFAPLSFVVLGISLWWFWKRKVLMTYGLPTLAVLLLFVVKFHNVWHEGILWLAWIFALWQSFDEDPGGSSARIPTSSRETAMVSAAISAVLAFHLFWSASTALCDFRKPYSGSLAAAEFLKSRTSSTISAVGFHAIGILPYFENNVFDNYHARRPPSFWDWSTENDLRSKPEQILADRPDFVVYGIKSRIPDGIGLDPDPRYLLKDYRKVAEFKGGLFWKGRVFESETFVIFNRRSLTAPIETPDQARQPSRTSTPQ